ncbi:MAG: sugar phosphate nucleotidyltransferase, partial [Chloroflexota bacterium]
MKRVTAVVLAGGEGERLSILSAVRAKPAVPFAGKYRIIDFTLSNCVNSDIDNVLILTQYNPRSLNDHIGAGRPWDLDRNIRGIHMLQPYIARGRQSEWYRGTADAVLLNIDMIRQQPGDVVLVLAGDHIYKMDYQPYIAFH